MPNLKYAFMGTPRFAALALEELIAAGYAPALIITASDKPFGRDGILTPSPVKKLADAHGIPAAEADTKQEVASALAGGAWDAAVVAAFNVIIPKEALAAPRAGTFNIHPSLLPEFRGPSPIQSAILAQKEETGVCIMLLDEKVDHGPILACERTLVEHKTYLELEEELARRGGKLMADVLPHFVAGETAPRVQDHARATYTKKFTVADSEINFETMDTADACARVRALNPEPGTWTMMETKRGSKRVKILSAAIQDGACVPLRVTPEGKKEMSWEDFVRGNL